MGHGTLRCAVARCGAVRSGKVWCGWLRFVMNILVTGGTGSFGTAFMKAALGWPDVERLVCYSRDEHKQQRLHAELGDDPQDRLRFFLGDVRDQQRLQMALHGISHCVHGAALKVVPWLEYNPSEGLKTNTLGAMHLVDAAIQVGVGAVVALSTDKAVSPVNLYGASKLAAEKLFLAANALGGGRCRFTAVRYGNVTGSTGSVVPLWRAKAKADEGLPLTDDRMTRFWMSMDEAVELVRKALIDGCGGEVLIPKLPSYRVTDLAEAVWREQNPTSEWRAKYKAIGIRPGEKLHESLVSEDEWPWTYDCGTHYEVVHVANGGPGGRSVDATVSGRRVPDGFKYRSDENERWLTKAELQQRLLAIP